MKSKKEVLKQFKEHKKQSSALSKQWKHIEECRAFYSGNYMKLNDSVSYRGQIQPVCFNQVKPYVNAIVGFMAQNRRKPSYEARIVEEQQQRERSDYLNGLSDKVRENTNADHIETKQDMDMVVGGIGATDTAITIKAGNRTRNPSGEIIVERVDPKHAGWDADARETNLLDARFVYRAVDYSIEEAEELFNAEEDDFETVNTEDDADYEFNGTGGIQDKVAYEWSTPQKDMVRVYFYQWFEVESFFRVENPVYNPRYANDMQAIFQDLSMIQPEEDDGMFAFDPKAEILVLTKDNKKLVKDIFALYDIKYSEIAEKRKVYYTAIISGDKVFSVFKSPSQDGFSMKFKTGDWDDTNKIWTGIVASMRDPQKYADASLTKLLLIIASNSKGGVLYERSAVENIAEFEARYAMHDAAIMVEDGAISGGKIMNKATAQMNTGYEAIIEFSNSAFAKVTGIDESFFGVISGGNETAMLQRQRIKQATTTLACYFDAIALYGKEQAKMMLSFMRLLARSSRGDLFMRRDQDGKPVFNEISIESFADEYDIVIGEAPETAVQQEYYTQTLINLGQSMQAIGDPRYLQVFAAALKYMPMPARDKNQITEILTGEQQVDPALVQQLQARIQQLESRESQAMLAKLMSDAEKNMVSAQKMRVEIEGVREDTEKKAIENDIMAFKSPADVNVVI